MIKDFILPDIGEGIVECELVEWLVQEGQVIEEDQPVADVMTDKALVQIPSPYSGRVVRHHYAQGDVAKVHSPLFAVEIEAEDVPVAAAAAKPSLPSVPAASPVSAENVAPEDFILPDIGEGIVECELVEWLIAEGDQISEDQPVADLMTDKALVQIPAPKAGKVVRLYYAQGEIARVHQPLFAIIPTGDDAVSPSPSASTAATVSTPSAVPVIAPVSASGKPLRSGKALASPAVRRLARELNIDLSQVPGSGRDGRVMKDDIATFQQGTASAPTPAVAAVSAPVIAASAPVRVEPIRGIRAAMARQMTLATQTIPHFTYGDEVDLTALLQLRQQLKPQAEKRGVRLTMMPFFMKAMAMAVQQYPILNSRVNAECTEIHYLPQCNIGMAVDSKIGLLVPNVKGVEKLSILDIAREIQRLTESAREGRVAAADLQGGTISISNIGALGGTYAVPVINAPEVAIVALGKTRRLPRFDAQGQVEARDLINISWSGDHRVIDGGTIARFSALWQSYLEDPASMLLDLA